MGYQSRSTIFLPTPTPTRPIPANILSTPHAGGQHAHRRSRLRRDLPTTHGHESAVAGNAVYRDEQQRWSRLEDIGVRGKLGSVDRDRAVALDSVGVVELQAPLTHVHRVRREPWTYQPHRRISRRVVRIAIITRGGERDVKVVTTIRQRRRYVLRCWALARAKIRGVKVFRGIRRRVRGSQIHVRIRVGASDHDGAVRKQHSRRVVQTRNG